MDPFSLEDLPEAMDDRDEWRERERGGESVLVTQHDDDEEYSKLFNCKQVINIKLDY